MLGKTNARLFTDGSSEATIVPKIVNSVQSNKVYNITYGNGIYAFCGYGDEFIQHSTDGLNFTPKRIDGVKFIEVQFMKAFNKFLILGQVNNDLSIFTTEDFSEFSERHNLSSYYPSNYLVSCFEDVFGVYIIGARYGGSSSSYNMVDLLEVNSDLSTSVKKNFVQRSEFNSLIPSKVDSIKKLSNGKLLIYANSYNYIFDSNKTEVYNLKANLEYLNGYYIYKKLRSNYAPTYCYSLDLITENLADNLSGYVGAVYLDGKYVYLNTTGYRALDYLVPKNTDEWTAFDNTAGAFSYIAEVNGNIYTLGSAAIVRYDFDTTPPQTEANKLSAAQALRDAKEYSDEYYAEVDARLRALEGK